MKHLEMKLLLALLTLFTSTITFSQGVGIGTTTPSVSTILHVDAAKDNTSASPSAAQQLNDFAVTSSGSVGIGTIAPTQKLHVNGTTRLSYNSGTAGSTLLTLDHPAVANSRVEANYFQTTVGSIPANSLMFNSTGSHNPNMILGINGNPIFFIKAADGNVGIGTDNPLQKLDVAGNVKFSGALMPNNNAGTSGQVLVSSGTNAAPIWQNLASLQGGSNFIKFAWTTYSGATSNLHTQGIFTSNGATVASSLGGNAISGGDPIILLAGTSTNQNGYMNFNLINDPIDYNRNVDFEFDVSRAIVNEADGFYFGIGGNANFTGQAGTNNGGITFSFNTYLTDNVAFFNGTSGFGTATLIYANRMPTVNDQSSVVKLKIRYMNGQRILFAYLNDSCIGIRNINFWNPSGQFIGIGARTGGNRDLHFVTGMRVLYP